MDQLRVFISSTQKELQAERDAVEVLIGELGYLCLRAEKYDSPGTSSQQACCNMARHCDIYLGIFGGRYGYKVPSLNLSATEMEFLEAKNRNPEKVFIYIKEVGKVERNQQRFLADVQSFSDGYFRHAKFRDCSELKEQVRRDLITWITRNVRRLLEKEVETKALRDKVAHLSRVMEMYGIPEDLR